VNFILVGCFLLGACELLHVFVCKGKKCNKYAENIKRQITFNRPGDQPHGICAHLGETVPGVECG